MDDPNPPRAYFVVQRAAHRLRVAADRASLDAAGVTAAQLTALAIIADNPGCSQRRLATILGQRESAITTMISRLGAAGLVSKAPSADEHRALSLHATDSGAETIRATSEQMDVFNERVRELLGPHLAATMAGLQQILDSDL